MGEPWGDGWVMVGWWLGGGWVVVFCRGRTRKDAENIRVAEGI